MATTGAPGAPGAPSPSPVPPPAPSPAPAAPAPPHAAPVPVEIAPNQTIYINNLNEKIKKEELVSSLRTIFSQFGNILDIVACKTLKLKGQAWVIFDDVNSATTALNRMQDFPLHDKGLKIQYAKTKSDAISKLDGTFIPKEKRKKMDERAERRKREHHEAHAFHHNQQYHHAPRPTLPEAPAPPNNILFVQKLPHDISSGMLQFHFAQIPGFREVRMVENKPGIAFVEYADEHQASLAKNTFHGYRINECPMHVTYAKR